MRRRSLQEAFKNVGGMSTLRWNQLFAYGREWTNDDIGEVIRTAEDRLGIKLIIVKMDSLGVLVKRIA